MRKVIQAYDKYLSIKTDTICVTGCGPNLNREHRPINSFVIGVNRSFELITPDIICTADERFVNYTKKQGTFLNRRTIPAIMPILYSIDLNMLPKDRVLFALKSGTFGIWIASLFGPKEIHLTGFGGKGHFYKDDPSIIQEDEVEYQRRNPGIDKANNKEETDKVILEKALAEIHCEVIIH